MNKAATIFLVIHSIFFTTLSIAFNDKKLMVGSIQFPKAVQNKIEDIRIYCSGKKINTMVDQEGKKISFSLSEYKYRTFFYLLIIDCQAIGVEQTQENTIKYLKVLPNFPYKFYTLELIDYFDQKNDKGPSWRIKEARLQDDRRIPDDAIIVCCSPKFIAKIDGGSEIELPKIYIKENILDIVGSDNNLHDTSIEALLSSIDYDALHSSIKQHIRQDLALKTVIIAPDR